MANELYLRRCLELASLGISNVSPNPMVGCVIVCEDKVIGEGYHAKFGEAHAEVNAVKAVFDRFADQAPLLLSKSTAYVSLEPCAHFGKTPPCADLLIRHRIKKVVIGNRDPFADVDGKGIEKLKAAGIEVVSGVLEAECSHLNRRFFTRIQKQRPYIILKWAKTADGFFGREDHTQKWITGALAKKLAHKWRTEEDAILVGKNTAITDNPQLNSREWPGKNPIRIVIDRHLQVPLANNLYNNQARTIIFNERKTDVQDNIHFIQMEDMQFYLPQKIAFQLYLMDIQSVIIEGGANLLNQFINNNLWDEARIFTSTVETWGSGIASPKINGTLSEEIRLKDDTLTILQNKHS
ncbi:bifunctional diaminohydroxyphosphoribosylaminopyrimidine deaminase/5-amino-6-(5-phosphoribosylamino)uracil reductase RibD [Pedobacter sp. MC2016-24]|uniref:bifunctional diaminohydroxyphosphoribosylaminopyrimidine deaminase/5-amino-6-(5-phosphoribosylamino)uracil reductase RibD n=1 Tax=Pedobacter sp. MC2016-24 TaxID=2780090 RepID=UPI0018803D04|nr:bifunctional diaminohydroxyphosphoribosylaminopyrimidine deaminase/5-amino-6-(5-phosphoribosylamino)uracil reductase RibD [Pedobacter sp. MC2016-24]MBE9597691.1 bifunctional diaminohydroxyphosphoribosylaminopyrimidine deaminase/5-amino-6-(5-phosphoribosylamino)uracil reductase RibD [Pedobacter sp. MC2016-24]